MQDLEQKQTTKREKTLLAALLLSSPGPIATGIAAFTSRSATQIADFLRRTAELVALFVSWWAFRKLHQGAKEDQKERLERAAFLTVALAMLASGVAMLAVGVSRLFVYKVTGSVALGFTIATLGLLTNTWFWWRYRTMTVERRDSVIVGQEKLYRAKALVDLVVVFALALVLIFPESTVTRYMDALGCIAVASYVIYSGAMQLRKGKTVEEIARFEPGDPE